MALNRKEGLVLGSLTLLALALRLWRLDYFEIWVDEGATWLFARNLLTGGLGDLTLEPTPPVYYALVSLFVGLLGDSDWVLRLPGVLFGTATVPAVYFLGRRFFGVRAGTLAAILLTIHPLHIFYSREARVYPLLLLLAVLWLHALGRALDLDTRRAWAQFGLVLGLACAVHITGLFLGFASGALILALAPTNRVRWRGLLASALVGLCLAPWFVWTLPRLGDSGAAWIVEYFYQQYPEDQELGRVLEQTLFGADHPPYMRQMSQPSTPPLWRALGLLTQGALLLLAVSFAWGRESQRWTWLLFGGWLLPILVPWGLSHGWRPFFQSGRHDVYALGAVVGLLAVGVEALWQKRGTMPALMAVLVVLGLAGWRLQAFQEHPPGGVWRATGAWLGEQATAEDLVIATGVQRLAAERYVRLAGSEVPIQSFPASTDEHPGWSDVQTLMADQEALHREGRDTVAGLEARRVFVLLQTYESRDGAVSATWLVDRHLMENLWASGWRQENDPQAEALNIAIFQPPNREVTSP